MSGLSIKKKRYIENIKERNVAINTYTVALSISPQNKLLFIIRIKTIIPKLKNLCLFFSNQFHFIVLTSFHIFAACNPYIIFLRSCLYISRCQSNSIINYLDEFNIHEKTFKPHIPHQTGFGLSLLKGRNAHIHSYELNVSEAFLCLEGEWEVTCNDRKVNIGPQDTFSAPKNSIRSIKQVSDEEGSVFLIRQKN